MGPGEKSDASVWRVKLGPRTDISRMKSGLMFLLLLLVVCMGAVQVS